MRHGDVGAITWSASVSVSGVRVLTVKLMFYTLAIVVAAFTITVGALLFALEAFSLGDEIAKTVSTGCVYMGAFAFVLIINVAVIYPGLMLLQPFRLWRVLLSERDAVTPRQRFRGKIPPFNFNRDNLSTPTSCIPKNFRRFLCYQCLRAIHDFCIRIFPHLSVDRTGCSHPAFFDSCWCVILPVA